MSYTCITAFLVLYGNLRGIDGMGYYFTVYAICLLASRPLYGVLSDHIGIGRVIPVGLLCFALSLFLVGIADSLSWYLVAAAIGAFGYGAVQPLLQSLSLRLAPSSSRGAASNTNYAGLDLGTLIGPTLGGGIIGGLQAVGFAEIFSYSAMYFVLIVPVLASLVVFLIFRKTLTRGVS